MNLPEIESDVMAPPVEGVDAASGERIRKSMEKFFAARDLMTRIENGRCPKSVLWKMNAMREVLEGYYEYAVAMNHLNRTWSKWYEQTMGERPVNANRRWTPEQDEALIDFVTRDDGDTSVQALANTFGRTPGSITARLSHLVGIKRISTSVAGQISGFLNGEEVEGTFVGEVRHA